METEVIYMRVVADLKKRIHAQEFPTLKLPDERSLAAAYDVSRSSIKRALIVLAQQGIIFKKRGSGTFVNPLYLKKQPMFQSAGQNLGVSDAYRHNGEAPAIKVLEFETITADDEVCQDLFLEKGERVYRMKRLRVLQGTAFMIEHAIIPVKLLPDLTADDVKHSLFQYTQNATKKSVTKSFLTVTAEPSDAADQELLALKPVEPVGVMSGIYFLDDGTPFEMAQMRVHYKYMEFNSFDSLDGD